MKMTFIGATHEVTDSCTYLETCGRRILIDFGMEQGKDTYENVKIPCAPSKIDYVLLTHAHIDHSGLLPLLYAGGFSGEIHATAATANLCEIMLQDSAHIQEFEAEWRSRKAQRRGEPAYEPLYTMEEAVGTLKLFRPHAYGEWFSLFQGVEVCFYDAGHLLGSSSIALWLTENDISKKLVFSGDIGNLNQPLIRDPQVPNVADYVIMESTYGNRLHEKPKGYIAGLVQVLRNTFSRGGNVIIPAFAVGRTQEMLYYFKQIKDQHLLPEYENFPVYMDSSLAIEATEIFMKNKESCFDEEALSYVHQGENPIGVSGLIHAVTSDESKAINNDNRPKVILSASGMCDAGRIKHHLKHNLWKSENIILFVGYQAEGSLGRKLISGTKRVTLFGEEVQVNAQIVELPGMSGHADQKSLLHWVQQIKGVQKVFIVHGAAQTVDIFRDKLWYDLGLDAYAPYSGAEFDVSTGRITYDAEPQLSQAKPKRNSMIYNRLTQTLERMTAMIQDSRGLSNKELAKMADQLNELCAKWERR